MGLKSKIASTTASAMFCRKRRAEQMLEKACQTQGEKSEQGKASERNEGKLVLARCEVEVYVVKRKLCEHDPVEVCPDYPRDNGEFLLRCRHCGLEL